jgi:zinc transport system permease protein
MSAVCAAAGILASILAGTPVGSTIVIVDIIGFFIFCLTGCLIRRR